MDRHQQRDGDAEAQDPAAAWRTATCTCGRARTPGRAASTGGRGTRAAPGARSSRSTPAAARRATSSAMVTLSRKRRCTRVLTVRRNQVAAAETPSAAAATCTRRACAAGATPSPSSLNHSASSASGSAAQQRQGERRDASGRGSCGSRACTAATSTRAPAAAVVAGRAAHVRRGRHTTVPSSSWRRRSAAPAGRTWCGSGRRAPSARRACRARSTRPCSSTQMRSAWRTVEKRCEMRIVVQWRVAARMRSKISASPRTSSCAVGSSSSTTPAPSCTAAQRPRQRDALPLAAGEIGAARRSPWRGSCRGRRGSPRRPTSSAARIDLVRARRAGRDVVAQRQLEADEVLEHGGRRASATTARSSSRRSTPSTSIAPACGS